MAAVNAAATATERAGEAATVAIAALERGNQSGLSDALLMAYGDDIDAACRQARPVDQSRCPRPPCPAMLGAIGVTATAVSEVTGRLGTELLAALVVAVRRLAELQALSSAEVVADLVNRTAREC